MSPSLFDEVSRYQKEPLAQVLLANSLLQEIQVLLQNDGHLCPANYS
jgi:hypothetical protein